MRKIRAVIFDLGRVLVDLDFSRGLFRRLVQARGRESADKLMAMVVHDRLFAAYCRGRYTPREFHRKMNARTGLDLPYPEFTRLWCDIFKPMPGMAKLFRDVAKRVPVGLLSDTDPLHWAHLKRRLPFLKLVKRPTLSYKEKRVKPARVLFRAAAKNVGLQPRECFYVDDLPANVRGARAVGLDAVRFRGVEDLRQQLVRRGVLQ